MSLSNAKSLMGKTLDLFKESLIGIGPEINDSLVSNIKIEYNGQNLPMNNVASIVKQKRQILITPFEQSLLEIIYQTIQKNNFDVHKFSKQSLIINIPMPSGDEIKKIEKHINKMSEDAKVSIRNIRRKFKNEENNKEIQRLTDEYITEIEYYANNTTNLLGQ